MKREWQCGTIQIDFNMPAVFDLEYVAADQTKRRPVMIHRAIYGSIERFLGILLEHFKGALPFWLAPVQVRILTITDRQRAYATSIEEQLRAHGIRVECDRSGDKISAQIRKAQLDKIPWMLVVGQKEEENKTIVLRLLDGKQQFGLSMQDVLAKAQEATTVE